MSAERIREEFVKILLADPSVLDEHRSVIGFCIPEVIPMFDFKQNNPHHHLDVWQHTLTATEHTQADEVLRLAVFFHDIGKPQCYTEADGVGHFYGHAELSVGITSEVLHRLKFSKEVIEAVTELVKYHDADVRPNFRSTRRWLNRIGELQLRRLLLVKRADALAQSGLEFEERLAALDSAAKVIDDVIATQQCFDLKDLAISGSDLIAQGLPEGPEIGAQLKRALDAVIDGTVQNGRTELLVYLGHLPIRP